jgi:hypothetical protein
VVIWLRPVGRGSEETKAEEVLVGALLVVAELVGLDEAAELVGSSRLEVTREEAVFWHETNKRAEVANVMESKLWNFFMVFP